MTIDPVAYPPQGPIDAISPPPPVRTAPHHDQATRTEAEEALVELLRSHGSREGSVLETYAGLVESCADAGVRFLLQLLLDDEARHHLHLEAMLNNLASFTEDRPIGPRLPMVGPALAPELLAEMGSLVQFERDDARDLDGLRKALRSAGMPRQFELLVELMHHDTAKHIAILEYISKHAGE